MPTKFNEDTKAIIDKIYPMVEGAITKSGCLNSYKRLINEFISNRSEALYDNIPCSRLVCSENEMDKIFDVFKIKKSVITNIIKEDTYYGKISNFSPLAAKHEFTIIMLCLIRYFVLNNMDKEKELACIHLSFSGKFYPSLHFRSYPTVPPARHIMEYVVNSRLSKKFDLIVYGSVLGAVRSVSNTWVLNYKDRFETLEDYDVKYLIDQLYSRIGSFIKNIAEEYYEVYNNPDETGYISYTSDSGDEDDYRIAENNTTRVNKYTESAMNHINTNGVEYKICKYCSTSDITPNECRAVIESIISNRDNIPTIKELISLMISLYFATGKNDLTDIEFITYTISPKPNAKQKEIVRMKEIIEIWLCESGTAYMRRRSRIATKNAYERCVRMYFALIIHNSAR